MNAPPENDEALTLAGGGASGTTEDGNLRADDTPGREVKGTARKSLKPLTKDAILSLVWPMSDPVPVLPRPPKPERVAVVASTPDLARLRSALAAIPNTGAEAQPYDIWRNVCFAVHHATGGSDEGLELFREWSAESEKHDDDFLDNRVWCYAGVTSGEVITERSLYALAAQHGWTDPTIADDFDVIEAPAGDPTPLKSSPTLFSAADLLGRAFNPIKWVIPEILPEGVFLLVASPKIGKSWLALQMVLAVGTGTEVLGRQAAKGSALYLALEDNPRRLQARLKELDADILLNDAQAAALQFSTEWPRVDQGGDKDIAGWLGAHPDAKLVVIDVLERFRPARSARGNLYAEDYNALKALKAVADEHRVTIVVVHHTRKGASDDPMAMVSGTQGLAGAADGMLLLERPRGEARGSLHVIGRDVESDGEFVVEFNDCRWNMVGSAKAVASTLQRQEILDALNDAGGPLTANEVADAVGKKRTTVARLLSKMVNDGTVEHRGNRYSSPHSHLAVEQEG